MNLPWPHKSPYSISGDFVKYFEENKIFITYLDKGPLYISINLTPKRQEGPWGWREVFFEHLFLKHGRALMPSSRSSPHGPLMK
jgi:hypothetical protein